MTSNEKENVSEEPKKLGKTKDKEKKRMLTKEERSQVKSAHSQPAPEEAGKKNWEKYLKQRRRKEKGNAERGHWRRKWRAGSVMKDGWKTRSTGGGGRQDGERAVGEMPVPANPPLPHALDSLPI